MKFYINTQRLPWIDNVKFFAGLCVVLGHVTAILSHGHPQVLSGYIASFNIPLFIFVSGLMVEKGVARINSFYDLILYFYKLYKRLLLPSVCMSAFIPLYRGELLDRKAWIIFLVLNFICITGEKYVNENHRIIKLIKSLYVMLFIYMSFNLNYFWFTSTLILLQIVFSLFYFLLSILEKQKINIEKYKCPIACLLTCVLVFFLKNSWTTEMSTYYLLAILFSKYKILDKLMSVNIIWCIISLAVASYIWGNYTRPYLFYVTDVYDMLIEEKWIFLVLRQIVALVLSVVFIRFIYSYLSSKYSILSSWGSKTLEIYLIHALFLELFILKREFLFESELIMWIAIIASTCVLWFASLAFIYVFEKSKFTRICFLGRSK